MGGKQEPNTQHKCCGNISCSNCVGPLAHLLSHVSLRNLSAPATLQQPCARLCVSRQAKATPPKPSPPERSPAAWPMAKPKMAKPKFQTPVPINRWSPHIPKAQSIESYEYHDGRALCAHLGILEMQPKSPPKAPPKPPPFNVFGAKASLPHRSASADSAGTTYSEEVWRGDLEEIKRSVN